MPIGPELRQHNKYQLLYQTQKKHPRSKLMKTELAETKQNGTEEVLAVCVIPFRRLFESDSMLRKGGRKEKSTVFSVSLVNI